MNESSSKRQIRKHDPRVRIDIEGSQLLTQLVRLEEEVSYRQRPDAGQNPFLHLPGRLPILISAPHAAAHMREGKQKPEDDYTAAPARYAAAQTGAHVLYATHLSDQDPNWDEECDYKHALKQIVEAHKIRFVIDLHGMGNRYKIGLALGTIRGKSCPDQLPYIRELVERQRFRIIPLAEMETFTDLNWDTAVFSHPKFTGGVRRHTITRFASQTLGVPAVQIEMCSNMRIVERGAHGNWPFNFYGDPAAIQRGVDFLIDLVGEMNAQTK